LDKAKGKEGIEDYKVICDSTNNTSDTIAKGELRCDIWIKPVYAVRYIRLTFIGSKAGTSFDEV
jgi:phage tail sheath protein FI